MRSTSLWSRFRACTVTSRDSCSSSSSWPWPRRRLPSGWRSSSRSSAAAKRSTWTKRICSNCEEVVSGWWLVVGLRARRQPPATNHQPPTTMLKFIVLAPLVGAIINGLFGRRFLTLFGQRVTEKLVGFIACASVGVSTVLAFIVFSGQLLSKQPDADGVRRITEHFFTWI